MVNDELLNPVVLNELGFQYRRDEQGAIIYYKDAFTMIYEMKTHSLLLADGKKIATVGELAAAYTEGTGQALKSE